MSDDNKKTANNRKFIQDRRERVLMLMARGANVRDIARALDTTKNTIFRDLKYINRDMDNQYSKRIREGIPMMYETCLQSINDALKEVWGIHIREVPDPDRPGTGETIPDPKVTTWHHIGCMRLIGELTEKRFNIIQAGPSMMEINKLKQKVEQMKQGLQLTV